MWESNRFLVEVMVWFYSLRGQFDGKYLLGPRPMESFGLSIGAIVDSIRDNTSQL